MTIFNRRSALAAMAATIALGGAATAAAAELVIENVTVVPMSEANAPLPGSTVVIRDGRIAAIGKAGTIRTSAAVKRIDGRGRWLMPALTDAHVHLANDRLLRLYTRDPAIPHGAVAPADTLLPYVANGVLQVVNMGAMSEAVGLRSDVESGRILGPHLVLGAMIDGDPPTWPLGFSRVAVTPENGRQAVRDAKAEGYDFIKLYGGVRPDTAAAIVTEANAQEMKAGGHLPRSGATIESWLVPGFSLIAHAEELAYISKDRSDADALRFARLAKERGVVLVASLTLNERLAEQARDPASIDRRPELRYLAPFVRRIWTELNPYRGRAGLAEEMDSVAAFNRKLVRAFAAEGVPILAGTDSLIPGVAPGFALHDELEALVAAGLSPDAALAAATRLPAQWLGVYADRGSVEVGKRADLLLLDADPLKSVGATRRIQAVILGGEVMTKQELDRRMSEMAARLAD